MNSIDLYISASCFIFRRGNKEVARAPFSTLEPSFDTAATEEDITHINYYLEEYTPGEVMKQPPAAGVVLGPPREFTHEVTLRAAGNPDFQQYADIAPRKTVRVCSIEEAQAVVRKYQADNNMGGGNCSKEHGVVWKLPKDGKGKRKSLGRVHYNGKFETHAETKAWEKSIKEKYQQTA